MEQYIKIMNEDDDKDTVSQVCSSIVEVIKSVTYDSVEKCKRELITSSLLSALFFSNTQKRPSTIIILGFNKKISRIFITCLYACCSHGLVVSVSQMGDTFFLWLFFWGIFCVWVFSLGMKAHFAGTDLSSCNEWYIDIPRKTFNPKAAPSLTSHWFLYSILLRNVLRF
jgi:hypothetical protein